DAPNPKQRRGRQLMALSTHSHRTAGVLVGAGTWVLLAIVGSLFHPLSPAATPPHPAGAASTDQGPFPLPAERDGASLTQQTAEEAASKSVGCLHCHQGAPDPHYKDTVRLGCVDCHGGAPTTTAKDKAHVAPRFPQAWPSSANPVRSYTLLNHEN